VARDLGVHSCTVGRSIRRSCNGSFRGITRMNPLRLRVESPQPMVEEGRFFAEEIARKNGFVDLDRMRRSFIRAFGQSPGHSTQLSNDLKIGSHQTHSFPCGVARVCLYAPDPQRTPTSEAGAARASENEKQLPRPVSLSTISCVPCRSAIHLPSASPNPEPLVASVSGFAPR